MTTHLGSADNGGAVTVAAGDEVEIALPENAGTGYRWQLADLPVGVTLVDERRYLGDPAVPGSGNRHVFRVQVGASGTVTAQLRRPWASGDAAEAFSVRLAVAEA